jgi:hypothetical protein
MAAATAWKPSVDFVTVTVPFEARAPFKMIDETGTILQD